MARLYPSIYASVLCMALIFVHTGESIDCSRPAKEWAKSSRKECIQSGTGGCGQVYLDAIQNHQRGCSFQIGRRSGGLATLLDDTQADDSPALEQWWNTDTDDVKFNTLLNRLREVAAEEEDALPQWLQDAILESKRPVPRDTIQRLLSRL